MASTVHPATAAALAAQALATVSGQDAHTPNTISKKHREQQLSPAPSDSDSGYSSRHSADFDRNGSPSPSGGHVADNCLVVDAEPVTKKRATSESSSATPLHSTPATQPLPAAYPASVSFPQATALGYPTTAAPLFSIPCPSIAPLSPSLPAQQNDMPLAYSLLNAPSRTAPTPSAATAAHLEPTQQSKTDASNTIPSAVAGNVGLWTSLANKQPQPVDTASLVAEGKAKLDAMNDFVSKGLQIRVLGVPQQNAKSRVETQIKICLQLVTDKGDKVPLWSHLRLPEYAVPREKFRRTKAADEEECAVPSNESSILSLEPVVVCASDVTNTVSTCLGCIQRERKRTRKKEANAKRAVKWETAAARVGPAGEDILDEESLNLEQKKVLLFNCTHVVDFSSGDTILPTRITCYCRHHSEKLGFCVYFIIRDFTGQIVATGMSPPIMITDDHKSSKTKAVSRKRQRTDEPMSPPQSLPANQRKNSVAASTTTSNDISTLDGMDMFLGDAFASLRDPFAFGGVTSAVNMNATGMMPISPTSPPQHIAFPHMQIDGGELMLDQAGLPSAMGGHQFQQDFQHQHHHQQNGADLAAAGFNADFTDELMMSLDSLTCVPDMSNFTGLNIPADPPATALTHERPTGTQQGVIAEPSVSRIIPAEGPLHGGVEVTILGAEFREGLTVMFGGIPAVRTNYWGATTLVCIAPPSPVPGPVAITFQEHPVPLTKNDLVMFTYKDEADRALMELALQVLGLRMTGKLEDARNIAMRIVADPTGAGGDGGGMNGMQHQTGQRMALDVLSQSLGVCSQLSHSDMERLLVQLFVCLFPASSGSTFSTAAGMVKSKSGHTLLHLSILAHMTTTAKWLISHRICDLNMADPAGFTALHFASWKGMWSVVHELTLNGACKDLKTVQGLLPIQLASMGGHMEVVNLLQSNIQVVADVESEWESEDVYSADDEEATASESEDTVSSNLPAELSDNDLDTSARSSGLEGMSPPPSDLFGDKLDDLDDIELVKEASSARPLGRFGDRPRRGKKGRGGRGGSGHVKRPMPATATHEDSQEDEEDRQLLLELRNGGVISDSEIPIVTPRARKSTVKGIEPIDTAKDVLASAESLLYSLAAKDPNMPLSPSTPPSYSPTGVAAAPYSWYTPLAHIPTLLALPVTLSATALNYALEDPGKHMPMPGQYEPEEDLPEYSPPAPVGGSTIIPVIGQRKSSLTYPTPIIPPHPLSASVIVTASSNPYGVTLTTPPCPSAAPAFCIKKRSPAFWYLWIPLAIGTITFYFEALSFDLKL
ncbi:hypothetical protein DFS34DRAFT_604180 [Phlyctochytrium arcticum]|nr:hypothetical protein DFS34DRAFT_604180 [Phlyctochytrium arcticum]